MEGFWLEEGEEERSGAEMATTMMTQMCSAAARRMMMTKPISPTYSAVEALAPVVCGRGDKKTKKGKRFKGSYGNSRPKKDKKIERIKDRVEVPRSTPWPLSFKLV